MEVRELDVTSAADLIAAAGDEAVAHIRIVSDLSDVPTMRLSPGQVLTGSSPGVEIRITVRRGIETHGGTGASLVKGVVVQLSATALSIKPGGSARSVEISGGLVTHGKGAAPLELHGAVGTLQITGGVAPTGGGFEGV